MLDGRAGGTESTRSSSLHPSPLATALYVSLRYPGACVPGTRILVCSLDLLK